MTRTSIVLLLILALVCGSVFVLFKMHRKVIDDGEYLGFAIGMEKNAVLAHAVRLAWVSEISAREIEHIGVKAGSTKNLPKLLTREGVYIHYVNGGQSLIFFDGNSVVYLSNSPILGGRGPNIDTRGDLRDFLKKGFRNGSISYAGSTLKGHSKDFNDISVTLHPVQKSDDGLGWLKKHDYWRFGGDRAWTELRLLFQDDILVRIEYLDYFFEWP